MSIGIRFEETDDGPPAEYSHVLIPDHADYEGHADDEGMSLSFWIREHPDSVDDATWLYRPNFYQFGVRRVDVERQIPYFRLLEGLIPYQVDLPGAASFIKAGHKCHIALTLEPPEIVGGERGMTFPSAVEERALVDDTANFMEEWRGALRLYRQLRQRIYDHINDAGPALPPLLEEHPFHDPTREGILALPTFEDEDADTIVVDLIVATDILRNLYNVHDADAAVAVPDYHVAQTAANQAPVDPPPVDLAELIVLLHGIRDAYDDHQDDAVSHRTGGIFPANYPDAEIGINVQIGDWVLCPYGGRRAQVVSVEEQRLGLTRDVFVDLMDFWMIIRGTFTIKMYVNGKERESATLPAVWPSPPPDPHPIYFGTSIGAGPATVDPFMGDANEFLFVGRALTPREVRLIYNRGDEAVSEAQLDAWNITDRLGHWPMDEGAGTDVVEAGGVPAKDGTFENPGIWVETLEWGHVADNVVEFLHEGDCYKDWLRILQISWVEPNAPADEVVLTNFAGEPLFNRVCAVGEDGLVLTDSLPISTNGLRVAQLDSGHLRLIVE